MPTRTMPTRTMPTRTMPTRIDDSSAAAGADGTAAAAEVTMLAGARVERVDLPERQLLCVTLYHDRTKRYLLVGFSPQLRGLALGSQRPKGEPAVGFARRLRVALSGARLDALEWLGERDGLALGLRARFTGKGQGVALIADFDAQHPNLLLEDATGRIVGAADERAAQQRFGPKPWVFGPGKGRGAPAPRNLAELAFAGAGFIDERADQGEQRLRQHVRQLARANYRKAKRRVEAISADLARTAQVPALRAEGNLLLCHLPLIPRGESSIDLRDESVDPPAWRTISLDPALNARKNAEVRFERARRIERGVGIASTRLAASEQEVVDLEALLAIVEDAPVETLEAAAARAGIALPTQCASPPRSQRGPQAHSPYRTFLAANGRPILVGKGGADNDTLTLTVARPFDLWLHARNLKGAHVVIPCNKGTPAPAEQVLDAAHLAAHFSEARAESVIDIQIADRKHVRKPKGTPPGFVLVDRERTLALRIEAERLRRLLASEQKADA
jgi:predicted ribosome quality control (RQC) complex YloA/Tae2 family protein